MSTDTLRFEYDSVGNNGKVRLTAKLADDVLAIDKLDVHSASARERFAKSLCKERPGIDRAMIDEELLKIANEVRVRQNKGPVADELSAELDVSCIIRPDRFMTPEVSGLTVATPVLRNSRPVGKWTLYLRWADGRREAVELPDSLVLPNDRMLWFHPVPGPPSITQAPAWDGGSRRAWVAGADPPDPSEVFACICKCILYYIDFPEHQAPGTTATLALWVILTYCYAAWPAIPYVYLGGPAESGKSRVFEVLARLVFRPLQSSNLSAAALFRTLDSRGGTLLYDEAERLKDQTPDVTDINSMLLAGYKRGGRATRLEPVGDSYRTVEFDVFAPKALACIKGLPPALASRCIPVMMFRAGPGSPKPRRHIDGRVSRWRTLRASLHALALDYGEDFLDLAKRSDVCPTMSGRQFELWQPLLALASWVEAHGATGLLTLVQKYTLDSIESGREEQTADCDEVLLRALTDLIREGQSPKAKEVLTRARGEEDGMLANWTGRAVSEHLKRYGIRTYKSHGRKVYGRVTLDDLRRIQTTYNIDLGLSKPGPDQADENMFGNVPHVPHVPPSG